MTNVAVVGATGYAGAELASILKKHPHASVTGLYSSSDFSVDAVTNSGAEVVFLATPNEVSAELAPELLDARPQSHRPLGRVPARRRRRSIRRGTASRTSGRQLLGEAVYGLHRVVQRRAEESAARREPRLLSDLDPARAPAADVHPRSRAAGDLRLEERRLGRRQEVRPRLVVRGAVRQLQGLRRRHAPARAGDPAGAAPRRPRHARLRPASAADRAGNPLDDACRLHARGDRGEIDDIYAEAYANAPFVRRAAGRAAAGDEERRQHAARARSDSSC